MHISLRVPSAHFNMALREMLSMRCVIDEQKFMEAAGLICGNFGVPKLHEDQQKALRALLEGRDIYFSAHTDYGKVSFSKHFLSCQT